MPVTRAPTARRARTNSRWLRGKAGSTKTTCMELPGSGLVTRAKLADAASAAQREPSRPPLVSRVEGGELAEELLPGCWSHDKAGRLVHGHDAPLVPRANPADACAVLVDHLELLRSVRE